MSGINLSDLPKTEIVDVHIASPGARVAAYLLNNLFTFLIWLPFIVMVVFTLDESKKLVSESSLFNTPEYFAITFFYFFGCLFGFWYCPTVLHEPGRSVFR